MTTLVYGDREIGYAVRPAAGLAGKIRIHVLPTGEVEVEVPVDCDAIRVRAAIQKRARWIYRQVRAADDIQAAARPRTFVSGETHFYMGRRYMLKVVQSRELRSGVELTRGRIEVVTRSTDPAAVRRRLRDWYQAKASYYFARRLEAVSADLSWVTSVPSLKLVRMTKQWGSCAPEGAIHLNPSLIRAPRHCIDYVLTHELCHLKERNHSRAFYALLDRHAPRWRTTKAELDGMVELLMADQVLASPRTV